MVKLIKKHFQEKLEQELTTLKKELGSIGRINPSNPKDWEALPEKMDVLPSDSSDVAENIESYEENTAVLKQLEIRFNEVKTALERIENNTYGVCRVCKKPIEETRLEANPAAETCLKHVG